MRMEADFETFFCESIVERALPSQEHLKSVKSRRLNAILSFVFLKSPCHQR